MRIDWCDEREGMGDLSQEQALMRRVLEQVLELDQIEMEVSIGVTLVDPERMREINRSFRGVDRVTDVLSFPMVEGRLQQASPAQLVGDIDPEDGSLSLGDLVICPDRAKEQAAEYGHSLERELGYLAAHGMLHLLGYDHEEEDGRSQMRGMEEAALSRCDLRREIDE